MKVTAKSTASKTGLDTETWTYRFTHEGRTFTLVKRKPGRDGAWYLDTIIKGQRISRSLETNDARTAADRAVLNFITPHQKWGIHSTYSDNLMMLTLNRGGPVVWLSEDDARRSGIEDNDWVEVFNINGAIAARAVAGCARAGYISPMFDPNVTD